MTKFLIHPIEKSILAVAAPVEIKKQQHESFELKKKCIKAMNNDCNLFLIRLGMSRSDLIDSL